MSIRHCCRFAVLFFVWFLALSHVRPLPAVEKPKLVVVISVDQLCQDYLLRFGDNFAETGLFRRVWNEGASYSQCHHQHAFTVTGPGHAVQLTGTYPNRHGIIGNNWFDRLTGKTTYCCEDPTVQVVGLPNSKGVSPRNMLVETAGDVLKLASGKRSKVFGVAIKDRVAMVMTGHNADGAFWIDDNLWATSTYYRQDIPGYLRVFNEQKMVEQLYGRSWELLLAKDKYHNAGPDENAWENPPKGYKSAFPHKIPAASEPPTGDNNDPALTSPFGNDVTLAAAREVVTYEQLGKDAHPDLLCINLSSNDFVGHAYGPHSLEVEDMTYHTDRQLGDFLQFLDQQVGPGQWTFALTADHGVAPIVEYAQQNHLPAKRAPLGKLDDVKGKLESRLRNELGVAATEKPLIQKIEDIQVYLQQDHPAFAQPGNAENFVRAQRIIRDWLIAQPHVAAALTREELTGTLSGKLPLQIQRTFHPRRSGDVLFFLDPFCVPSAKGTTHGSPWHYDTHVPLLLIGCGIKPGQHSRPVSPACLASTVAELVGVDWPSANSEQPLREALAK
jgi:predicted AlkP superfamily pyrophosphatase or phosphodiesterase